MMPTWRVSRFAGSDYDGLDGRLLAGNRRPPRLGSSVWARSTSLPLASTKSSTTRFQFMNQQKEDLGEIHRRSAATIVKLNRICRLRFKESFEEINEKFESIFPRLFRGGKAKLVLTDENDYSGNRRRYRRPAAGQETAVITLLSGGEKALTAVSLLFAIFLTKPSPFCFLDEVDAPLDDANIDRFNDMIKEMSQLFAVRPGHPQQEDHAGCRNALRHHHGGARSLQSRVRPNELARSR